MSKLRLSLGCGDYDRTRALREGAVSPEGIELIYITVPEPSELFWRMMRYQEFDVSEMSLSNYVTEREGDDYRFIALPFSFPGSSAIPLSLSIRTRALKIRKT